MTDNHIPAEWRYSINYGPEGEANYAFVYDEGGHLVSNLKIHHAIAVVEQMNDRAAQAERMARLEEALRGDWHGVFLDGRNEHGSHVLNLPQRSIELEQNSEGYFLPDEAEAILLDAEAKGFRAGDHGVVLVFDRCTDEGWFSHYEFKEVSPELTALLYGTPAEQDARALSQEGSDARAWPSGCLKPSSCERHKACMYVGCPNEGRDRDCRGADREHQKPRT